MCFDCRSPIHRHTIRGCGARPKLRRLEHMQADVPWRVGVHRRGLGPQLAIRHYLLFKGPCWPRFVPFLPLSSLAMFSWRRAWRGVALLLSCLLVYSRLSAPPTAVAHTAALPPAAKHRPPPLVDLAPAASSTPPLLASAAPARHAAADVPTRWAAEREEAHSGGASSHSSAPSNKVVPPPSQAIPSEARHLNHELAVDADAVHVALAADSHHFQALPGVILSAANRTSAPLAFHVLVPVSCSCCTPFTTPQPSPCCTPLLRHSRHHATAPYYSLLQAEQLAAATSALECFGVTLTTRGDSAAVTGAPGRPSVTVLPFHSTLTLTLTLTSNLQP